MYFTICVHFLALMYRHRGVVKKEYVRKIPLKLVLHPTMTYKIQIIITKIRLIV